MHKYIISLIFMFFIVSPVSAATWNVFNYGASNKAVNYFDADTVIKNGDSVTLWIKYVNDEKFPDDDGSYSTAQRYNYSCKNRNYKILSTSTYDKEGNFIKSYEASNNIKDVTPGTIGENMLKAMCTLDFPKNKSNELYYPVEKNDIYLFTKNYYKNKETEETDLTPDLSAIWYAFSRAYNDNTSYYFDKESVKKDGNIVTVWLIYVKNKKKPDNDGAYARSQKMSFTCDKPSANIMNESKYDKNRKFVNAYSYKDDYFDIKSGTLFDVIWKVVCTLDFPNITTGEGYFPVAENDVFLETEKYYSSKEKELVDLAPK